MVGQELEPVDVNVALEAVDLHPRAVVDVRVLFLCHGIHGLVVQKLHVADRLLHLDLAAQPARLPVKHGDVALLAAEEEVPS